MINDVTHGRVNGVIRLLRLSYFIPLEGERKGLIKPDLIRRYKKKGLTVC